MSAHPLVSHEDWVKARLELLAQEKAFTRQRDTLGRQIRELPWEEIEKDYVFDGPDGKEGLADLFAGRSQLIVYHFMFDPEWEVGCKSCSLLVDHLDPSDVHLRNRDVSLVLISRAPLAKLQAFRIRMGWSCKWVSSEHSDFNWDFQVSCPPEDMDRGETTYNYGPQAPFGPEMPGLSVFIKGAAGRIFHTYSSFARGLEAFLGVYRLLDVVPKGRDEADLAYGMEWVRHHDRYGEPLPE